MIRMGMSSEGGIEEVASIVALAIGVGDGTVTVGEGEVALPLGVSR